MTSKERVYTALQKREPDRVPVGEAYVDYPTIEQVIGRKTFYRSHAREKLALWDGRRDEVVDSQKRDLVEFVRRTALDIVPVWLVPARNQIVKKPRQIGVDCWEDQFGNVLQYVPQTEELVVVERGNRPFASEEQPAPDGSEWELWDYVVEHLGHTHFIIASGGTGLGIGGYMPTVVDGVMICVRPVPRGSGGRRASRSAAAGRAVASSWAAVTTFSSLPVMGTSWPCWRLWRKKDTTRWGLHRMGHGACGNRFVELQCWVGHLSMQHIDVYGDCQGSRRLLKCP